MILRVIDHCGSMCKRKRIPNFDHLKTVDSQSGDRGPDVALDTTCTKNTELAWQVISHRCVREGAGSGR